MFVDTNKEPEEFHVFNFKKRLDANLDVNLYDTLISVDVPAKRMLGKYGDAFCNFKPINAPTIEVISVPASPIMPFLIYLVDINK